MTRNDILRARRQVNRAYKIASPLVVAEEIKTVGYRLKTLLDKCPRNVFERAEGTKALKRTLVKIFSDYIRLKDADADGIAACFTCSDLHYWKHLDNGHFIKRQYTAVTYNERNCHPQCKHCNYDLQGNDAVYEKKILETYGPVTLIMLKANQKMRRYSRFELQSMISLYSEKVKGLLRNMNERGRGIVLGY